MLSNYNFNLNPYYDDFDETKGYYRILFKPGYAVQARELTQLQTQLQNQISKFGDHIFRDGSIVLGGNTYYKNVLFFEANLDAITSITDLIGKTFVGLTSGAKAKIITVASLTDTTFKIYFSYLSGTSFQAGEDILIDGAYTSSIVDNFNFSVQATAFSIDESIFYINGHFVYCEPQTIIIAENDDATCRIGLLAEESIVTSSYDTSLLDPALGSYNYSAPGADRYTISLTLISYAYDPSIDTFEENASQNFVELSRFVNGSQVSLTNLPIYSEIENTFARRTYDESGDYTVRAFNIKVKDHIYGNTDLLSLEVDPGKAYIRGYEFETIAPVYLNLQKARETTTENGYPTYINYGSYFLVNSLNGDLDYTGNKTVNLYNDTTQSNAAIGNCIVKLIDFESYDSGTSVYKIYVDNLKLSTGNAISEIRSLANTSLSFKSNVSVTSYTANTVSVLGNDNASYLLKIPKDNIKTLLLNGNSDTSYLTYKRFAAQPMISGTCAITNPSTNQSFLGSLTLSASDTRENFLVTVYSNESGTGPAVGDVLKYENGLRISVTNSNNITVTYPGSLNLHISVVAKISISEALQKTKLLQTGATKTIPKASLTNTISLGKSDCYELTSVIAVSNTGAQLDYTGSYDFNTGQTDILYDHGYITLKPGYLNPVVDNKANIVNVIVTFSYFAHSGSGSGFFSVDSYTGSGIEYFEIPTYTSSTGEVYDLKNVVDFRPRRTDDASTIDGTLFGIPSSIVYTDLEYYLSRIDKLVVTKERKFHLIKGIPAVNPSIPTDISDAMTLYILNVPAYTYKKEDVTNQFIENRRYTMRDIGKIEKRVERLEYYTTLSLLEKQAKDESIPSNVPTIDRFKNGILVDSFAGHSVGDVSNPDYRCSIDYINRVLRPGFSSTSYTFNINSGTNYQQNGDLITLPYTTETFVNQPLASSSVNLNPYSVFLWNGYLELDPPSDNWIDTYTRPDVVVNLNGENDVYTILANNVTNPASSGVRWSDWQTIINGTPQVTNSQSTSTAVSTTTSGGKTLQTTTTTTFNNQTTTITDELGRVGLDIKTGAVQTVTRDLGSKIVDTSIIPYIRSRLVKFVATGLKPNTKLYALFDGTDVSEYCFPATEITVDGTFNQSADSIVLSTNSEITGTVLYKKKTKAFVRVNNSNSSIGITGTRRFQVGNTINYIVNGSTSGSATITDLTEYDELYTNDHGDIAGSFLIPNTESLKFRTGERTFKLTDDVGLNATTAAAVKYVAQGLSQSTERTLVATRISTVSINPVFDVESVSDSTTKTTVIGTTTKTVDITPPPPPPPPPLPKSNCATTVVGGKVGRWTYDIDLGTGIGSAGINYNAYTVPDRYTIIWDGNEYTTGFVGSSTYNKQLNALNYPNVVGMGSGKLRFNKTKALPSTAKIIVDAPLSTTLWTYTVVCPEVNDVTPPLPAANSVYSLSAPKPAALTFTCADTKTTANVTVSASIKSVSGPKETNKIFNVRFTVDGVQQNKIIKYTDKTASNTATFSVDIPRICGTSRLVPATVFCTETNETINVSFNVARSERVQRIDPVAQTFFVESDQYPNGLFLESADLYFRTKSNTFPVLFELRPTVNGYPSAKDIIPFSEVSKDPEDVEISSDATVPTNFKFKAPVYLAPGEYCFVAKCTTDEYSIYTARIGDFLLADQTTRITQQPAVGSMFKSQNSSTWTPIQEEDVMFKLNKCVFDTSVVGDVVLESDFPQGGDVEYDLFFADGEMLNFAATSLTYGYKTTDLNNNHDTDFNPYQLGSNAPMLSRRKIRSGTGTDLLFDINMSTVDRNVSPVVDLKRLSTVLVQNIVNNGELAEKDFLITDYGVGYTGNASVTITGSSLESANAIAVFNANTGRIGITVDTNGSGYFGKVTANVTGGGASSNATVVVANELNPSGGNGVARYITRKVTLAPGFESTDLKLYLLANLPSGTSIQVYYKVAPPTSTFFESEPWYPMVVESSGTPSEAGFVDYKYKTPNNVALPTGDKFKTFSIKIVMYSTNSVRVPQIRDLRVIALDE